tara:strand:- start:4027 stop:4425 length:399 start_codon:yes stop_codon:yes gene_type:complete
MNYIDKLRNSGLRQTKQRMQICEVLFNTRKTFHFTINSLAKRIRKHKKTKISLATIYNTVHAFQKKGYLKQIPIISNQTYFDTNVSNHHHFYDLREGKLIDLKNSEVGPINIYKKIKGKKIKSVEVLVKLES